MHLSTFGTISHGFSPSALRSAQHFGTGHSCSLLHLYALLGFERNLNSLASMDVCHIILLVAQGDLSLHTW
jgi:hypothetical protein